MLRRPRTILVGLDPVHDGQPVTSHAVKIAKRFGAEVILFDAVYNQYVSRRYFKDSGALRHARQTLVREHLDRLERLAAGVRGEGPRVSTDAQWDSPLDEGLIRAAARHHADWIVVGLRMHPVHRRPFFTGSDWQLIRHAPCPLLLSRGRGWPSTPKVIAAVDPLHRHGKPEDLDRRILEAAAGICEESAGRLFVFHAFEPIFRGSGGREFEPLPVEFAEATLEGTHNAAVEALVDELRGCSASVRMAEGRPEDKLPELAAEIGADLVVMGAVARNPLQRVFIGSTAERVLDRLETDILVIKPAGFVTPVSRATETES
jgi:universal stress protein E